MASVRVLVHSFIVQLLLWTTSLALPIEQVPVLRPGQCEPIGKFSPDWFLQHTRPRYRQEIHGKALFYTKELSEYVKQLTCNSLDSDYVSIWQIWPVELYDSSNVERNPLRCIHNDHDKRRTFFENMSEAYARMARKHATVLHLSKDYANPPLEGIWGRKELPTLRDLTDVQFITKIEVNGTQHTSWRIPNKGAKSIVDKAIEEVQRIFRSAKTNWGQPRSGIADDDADACPMWNSNEAGFLDSLF